MSPWSCRAAWLDGFVGGEAGEAGQPDQAVVGQVIAVQDVQLLRAGTSERSEELDPAHHLREPTVGRDEQMWMQAVIGHDDPGWRSRRR